LSNPKQLSLYEVRIILKVLQQFGLLQQEPALEKKEKELRSLIVQKSVYSSIVSMTPFAIREFHRLKIMKRLLVAGGLFVGVDYLLMRKDFNQYIEECRKVAQRQIGKLMEESLLPM
jgi:hypothetical protein